MLKIEKYITEVRNVIADNTSLALTDVVTPELPQNGDNKVAVTHLGGIPTFDLGGENMFKPTFRTLIRGTENDTTTRALVDEVYNALNLKQDITFDGGIIIQILATTLPIFVGKDENKRNLYNITFNAKVEGE